MVVLGKALVPLVFVLSAALLIVTKGFSWHDFTVTFIGCALGIVALSAALSNLFLVRMQIWGRWLAMFGAILLIAPGLEVAFRRAGAAAGHHGAPAAGVAPASSRGCRVRRG